MKHSIFATRGINSARSCKKRHERHCTFQEVYMPSFFEEFRSYGNHSIAAGGAHLDSSRALFYNICQAGVRRKWTSVRCVNSGNPSVCMPTVVRSSSLVVVKVTIIFLFACEFEKPQLLHQWSSIISATIRVVISRCVQSDELWEHVVD